MRMKNKRKRCEERKDPVRKCHVRKENSQYVGFGGKKKILKGSSSQMPLYIYTYLHKCHR